MPYKLDADSLGDGRHIEGGGRTRKRQRHQGGWARACCRTRGAQHSSCLTPTSCAFRRSPLARGSDSYTLGLRTPYQPQGNRARKLSARTPSPSSLVKSRSVCQKANAARVSFNVVACQGGRGKQEMGRECKRREYGGLYLVWHSYRKRVCGKTMREACSKLSTSSAEISSFI